MQYVLDVMDMYRTRVFPGALTVGQDSSQLSNFATMNDLEKSILFKGHMARGPVGLLCLWLCQHNAALDQSLCVAQEGGAKFSVCDTPFNFLRPLVRNVVFKLRDLLVRTTRTALRDSPKLDLHLWSWCPAFTH